jgi:hypothetical protein
MNASTGPATGPTTHTGAQAVIANAVDPARRPDVLFRVRREEGHPLNPWWMIGAFLVVSGGVIALMAFIPGGA